MLPTTLKKKVVIALSGGVDSAVSAYLLREKGYEVTCVYMQNWDDFLNEQEKKNSGCKQNQDWKDAKKVAEQLQLPIHRTFFIDEYWNKVFTVFLKGIKKGLTPNPDVLCNKMIKFKKFIEYVNKEFQPDFIATGHYAKLIKQNNEFFLTKPKDNKKDQTYFLCQIHKKLFKKIIFPLEDLLKEEVRKIAKEIGLINAEKKDSVGLCFVGIKENKFNDFLTNYLPEKQGKVLDFESEKEIGKHRGVYYYTLGQRHGFFSMINHKTPFYIVGKDIKKNVIYVVNSFENKQLYSNWCIVTKITWLIDLKQINNIKKVNAKFRYQQTEIKVNILWNNLEKKTLKVEFLEELKAITPGQYAVFYIDDVCLGGGIIKETEKNDSYSFPKKEKHSLKLECF